MHRRVAKTLSNERVTQTLLSIDIVHTGIRISIHQMLIFWNQCSYEDFDPAPYFNAVERHTYLIN